MTLFYVILAAIFAVLLVIVVKRRSEPARIERYQNEFGKLYTDTLDVEVTEIVPEALIVQLNKALDYDYMEKVNTEFRLKYPRNSQERVNELWREFKRYLIMAAVFGKVEMFNGVIDELWHIMLNYKQEYDDFCQTFIGQPIQHNPHSQPVFKPEERTLFDFYYVQLFTVDSSSIQKWGKFFKHDKGKGLLHEFETLELEQLKEKYMRTPTSIEAEQTFECFTSLFKENRPKIVLDWRERYDQTDYAAPAYFIYASSDNHDTDFNDIFGVKAATTSSDSINVNHGGDHSSTYDGGSSSSSGSDSSSSCSSCSSCSS
ncbi:hypothetical protein JFV29_09770 [Peribacillus sp. TH16]|uniref:hypothetical protein n=1 Tax=unclassified Peribacillus TaxID=2675266 RepID=UPI0019123BE2|nr:MULTISPECIES: hypothetical protein [unclassified Peribacillus]MBK5444882.1 hypothetical protein [Peribacillus sp. TH24]MBK5482193.1 hypothetical protein [Peribacillus sp. TH16]